MLSFALIYCAFIVCVIGFQIALIAGAPWGHITQGGQHTGALPKAGRISAALSILILIGIALAILSAAGFWPNWPAWTGWVAVTVQGLSMVANWATRSAPERKLWAPITSAMFALALLVVIF